MGLCVCEYPSTEYRTGCQILSHVTRVLGESWVFARAEVLFPAEPFLQAPKT